jgi:hypothetical protein
MAKTLKLKAVKIDPRTHKQLREYCEANGVKQSFVFSQAVHEYLRKVNGGKA